MIYHMLNLANLLLFLCSLNSYNTAPLENDMMSCRYLTCGIPKKLQSCYLMDGTSSIMTKLFSANFAYLFLALVSKFTIFLITLHRSGKCHVSINARFSRRPKYCIKVYIFIHLQSSLNLLIFKKEHNIVFFINLLNHFSQYITPTITINHFISYKQALRG